MSLYGALLIVAASPSDEAPQPIRKCGEFCAIATAMSATELPSQPLNLSGSEESGAARKAFGAYADCSVQKIKKLRIYTMESDVDFDMVFESAYQACGISRDVANASFRQLLRKQYPALTESKLSALVDVTRAGLFVLVIEKAFENKAVTARFNQYVDGISVKGAHAAN